LIAWDRHTIGAPQRPARRTAAGAHSGGSAPATGGRSRPEAISPPSRRR